MDKNFINVDDLVRQRLEGREEREPSGAWLNMRELLDEEMPQRKVVPFFWNRMFGAVGIAALLGLITVGGYELSAYKDMGHTAPVASAATAGVVTGTAHNDATPTDVAGDRSLNATGVTDDAVKPADAAGVAAHKAAHKNTTTGNLNNTTTKTAKNNAHTAAENTATIGTTANKADNNTSSNNVTTTHSKKNAAKSTETATAAVVKNSAAKNNKGSQPATTAAEKVTTSTTVAGTTATTTSSLAVSDNSKQATTKHTGVAHDKTRNHKSGAATQPVATNTTAGNNSSSSTADDKDAVAKADKNTTDVHNMPLSSNSTPANNASESVPGKVSGNNMVPSKTSLPAANGTTPANTSGKPANTTTGTNGNGTPKTATVGKLPNNTTANNSKGKKVIERMVVFQRSIKAVKTEQSESKYHIDTVSIETLTEELGMVNPAMSSTPNAAAKKYNLGNMINTTTGEENANATILPGAASSATNAPGTAAKTNTATKNSGTTSPVEKLKEEFNDVKTKVSLIRFAPGLTAGINGTFFGPNSFKGFQFGLTGELFFNDDLGLMGEFKYFHRINNDYEVNDNYYSYTPVAGGYSKQLILNSYSFSALHSFEMPISIRYSKGNFTFIAGGNIVYSFSINTGASTIVSPTAPVATTVSPAQANDNKPQLNASDFNSRFGLGYLFGVAYKVSPNVTLDLRDVQSFWDNAGSAGAKSVSTQLYKSPSFQFSLNYRLGKKHRGE